MSTADCAATAQRLTTGVKMLRDEAHIVQSSLSECLRLADRLDVACKLVNPSLTSGADVRTMQMSLQNVLGGLADVVTLLKQHISAGEQRVPKLASAIEELELTTNAPAPAATPAAHDTDMIFGVPPNATPTGASAPPAPGNDPFSGLVPEVDSTPSLGASASPPPRAASSAASFGGPSFSPSSSPSQPPVAAHRSPSPAALGGPALHAPSLAPTAAPGWQVQHAPPAYGMPTGGSPSMTFSAPVNQPPPAVDFSDMLDLGQAPAQPIHQTRPSGGAPRGNTPTQPQMQARPQPQPQPQPVVTEADPNEYQIDLTPDPPAPVQRAARPAASRAQSQQQAASAALAEKYFYDLDAEGTGYVGGQPVRELWMKSNLPPQFLSEVWKECRTMCPAAEGLDLPAFVHGFERIRVARTQQAAAPEPEEEEYEEEEQEEEEEEAPAEQKRAARPAAKPRAQPQAGAAAVRRSPIPHEDSSKSSGRALFSRLKDLKYSPIENKVREATAASSNESVVTSPELVEELALATKDSTSYAEIWKLLWKRLEDYQYHDHVSKALRLLDMLIRHPATNPRIVRETISRKDRIAKLKRYKFYNANQEDLAADVRQMATALCDLLDTDQNLARARGRKDW